MKLVGPALLLELLCDVKDLPDRPWDDTALCLVLLDAGPTLHGVGLAGACLAVREHADVVSVQSGLDQLRDLVIDVALACLGSKHPK